MSNKLSPEKKSIISNMHISSLSPVPRPNGNNHYSGLHYIALLSFLLLCAGYYSTPLVDHDFWWHIANGREIVSTGIIPSEDPFGVFSAVDQLRNDTMLKSEWLAEVLLYKLYITGGENAVITFRVCILLVCLFLVYLRCRLLCISSVVFWPILLLVGLVVINFGGERPQLLSFSFAALFFLVIDRVEQTGNLRLLAVLPLLAWLWANCHGGVILGVALLGLWSAILLFSNNCNKNEKIAWLAASSAVLLASLATPNGIQTYYYLFDLENSVLQSRTSEYISTFQLYTLVGHRWSHLWIYTYYAVALVAIVGLYRQRKIRPLAVVLFLGAISATAFRYLIFFLLVAAPYIALGSQHFISGNPSLKSRTKQFANGVLIIVFSALLITGIVQRKVFLGGLGTSTVPLGITEFIDTNKLQGRAFNHIGWGGYFLWRLPSAIQLYIDGRMLDGARLVPYTHILWATPQGIQWFEQGDFQLVILPHHGKFDPQRYKLIDHLSMRPDWTQIYGDKQGVVFERRQAK